MLPALPPADLTSQVPSTKAWLLLLSLLSVLLLVGSRLPLPARGAAAPTLAARPAAAPLPDARRVALKSVVQPPRLLTASSL